MSHLRDFDAYPLTQTELVNILACAINVKNAWRAAGPNPAFHEASQVALCREWPTLAGAIIQLSTAMEVLS